MKHALLLATLVSLVIACKGDDDTGETAEPMTTGTVDADEFERSAKAETYSAVGFATNGVGVVVLSANPEATCASITEYFNGKADYNPIDVLRSGYCNTTFRFNYDSAAGFGGQVHTDADIGTFVNINCAMGEGEWELVNNGQARGYQFSGDDAFWWQGNANTFSITTTVGATDNTPDVAVSLGPDFGGQFIYEDLTPDLATGTVGGNVVVQTCQSLTQTPPWN